jgi:hypothetical protein
VDPNDFTQLPTCVVLHLSRDEDMRKLVTSGLIWRGGPKTQRKAVTWLIEHPDVPLTRVPERIAAYITAQRVAS